MALTLASPFLEAGLMHCHNEKPLWGAQQLPLHHRPSLERPVYGGKDINGHLPKNSEHFYFFFTQKFDREALKRVVIVKSLDSNDGPEDHHFFFVSEPHMLLYLAKKGLTWIFWASTQWFQGVWWRETFWLPQHLVNNLWIQNFCTRSKFLGPSNWKLVGN